MTTPQNKTTCSEKVASFILATSTALMIGKNYRNWDIDWANSRQRNWYFKPNTQWKTHLL